MNKLRNIFLATGMFFVTAGYSIAGDTESHTATPSDTFRVIRRTSSRINTDAPQVTPDTIWSYGYPVLSVPFVMFDTDGGIRAFQCDGLYYRHSASSDSGFNFELCESLHIESEHNALWTAAANDVRRRTGISDRRAQIMAVIQTIAYHYAVGERKKNTVNMLFRNNVSPLGNGSYRFGIYVKNFENMLARRGWAISSKGRLYDRRAHLRNQKQR